MYQRKTLLFPRSARIDGIRVYAPHADEKSARRSPKERARYEKSAKSKRARPWLLLAGVAINSRRKRSPTAELGDVSPSPTRAPDMAVDMAVDL